MSEFNCPKCKAVNKPTNETKVGCMACGFGKQNEHSHEPGGSAGVNTPPGYSGKYLTEDL